MASRTLAAAASLFTVLAIAACSSSTDNSGTGDDQNVTSKSGALGATCGGIAALGCGLGLECEITEKHPDASGKCVESTCKPVDSLHCRSGESVSLCPSSRVAGAPQLGRCAASPPVLGMPIQPKSACEQAGGSCVALSPETCKEGTVADAATHACGAPGLLGMQCCMPHAPVLGMPIQPHN
jgi:hypothetical protein